MESMDQAITDQTTVRTLDLVHRINPVLHNSTFRNRSLNASNHYFFSLLNPENPLLLSSVFLSLSTMTFLQCLKNGKR